MSASRSTASTARVLCAADDDADAGRPEELMVGDAERFCERGLQSLGDGADVLGAGEVLGQHRELVAAQPRQRVAGSELRLQPLRDRDQEAVADHVAEAVVHQLEAVEVDEQHRVLVRRRTRALRDRPLQQLAEERAVREVRQRVVTSGLGQRVADQALLGDVRQGAGHANRTAGVVADRDAAAQHPADLAAHVAHAILLLEVRALAIKMGAKRFDQRWTIFVVRILEPLLVRRDGGVGRQSDHELPAVRAVECVRRNVPIPQTIVRAGGRERIALLGSAGGFERRDRVAVQAQHFFLVAFLGGDPIHVHAIRTERQIDRRGRERHQPPLARRPQHSPRRRGAGADEVAGCGPQEIRLPDTPDALSGREPDRGGDDQRVDQVVGQRARHERLGDRLEVELAWLPTEIGERHARGLYRQYRGRRY